MKTSRRHWREGSALPKRTLRREADGSLYDVDERRRVSLSELRDDVRTGRKFKASRHDSGADCTYEVLADVVKGDGAGLKEFGTAAIGTLLRTVGTGVVQALADSEDRRDDVSLVRRRRRRRPIDHRPTDAVFGPESDSEQG